MDEMTTNGQAVLDISCCCARHDKPLKHLKACANRDLQTVNAQDPPSPTKMDTERLDTLCRHQEGSKRPDEAEAKMHQTNTSGLDN